MTAEVRLLIKAAIDVQVRALLSGLHVEHCSRCGRSYDCRGIQRSHQCGLCRSGRPALAS